MVGPLDDMAVLTELNLTGPAPPVRAAASFKQARRRSVGRMKDSNMPIDTHDAFMNALQNTKPVSSIRDLADGVMALSDVNIQRQRLVNATHANPLFVPRTIPQPAPLNSVQMLYFLSQLRMSAANNSSARIVVSSPMKSGSTFISDALGSALSLPKVSLMMLMSRPYDHPVHGASTRPHEIDELALLAGCLGPQGFVAHHHMICSQYLARQAEVYNLKFVLLKRNIFDCIVSLDDFCRKNFSEGDAAVKENVYLRMHLPPGWAQMPDEERIHHLLDEFLSAYVHYHVSWRLLERLGQIAPFWISYENDILGDKAGMAAGLSDWLGRSAREKDALIAEMTRQPELSRHHFNKGVSGRGKAIQGANRKRVLNGFDAFNDLADWSEILD